MLFCPRMHVFRWVRSPCVGCSKKRTSLHSGGGPPGLVQSSKKYIAMHRNTCCLRCGKSEGIDEIVDQCDDCLAMSFNID